MRAIPPLVSHCTAVMDANSACCRADDSLRAAGLGHALPVPWDTVRANSILKVLRSSATSDFVRKSETPSSQQLCCCVRPCTSRAPLHMHCVGMYSCMLTIRIPRNLPARLHAGLSMQAYVRCGADPRLPEASPRWAQSSIAIGPCAHFKGMRRLRPFESGFAAHVVHPGTRPAHDISRTYSRRVC